MFEADAAILTVRPPLLSEIALAAGGARTAAAIADIGYGNDATGGGHSIRPAIQC